MMQEVTEVSNQNRTPGRIYFSNEDDLHLLREVVGQNPYEDTSRWNVIQVNLIQILGKFISIRTLKDRVNNLTKKFIEKDRIQQFQSGVEEEITELDDLLRHIVDLINEFKKIKIIKNDKTPSKSSKRNDSSYQKGLRIRAQATSTATTSYTKPSLESDTREFTCVIPEMEDVQLGNFCNEIEMGPDINDIEIVAENGEPTNSATKIKNIDKENKKPPSVPSNILTPTRKRASTSLKQSTLAYLTKKNERWCEIRSRELALQERDILLREQKFELDKWERTKRIEMEEKKLNIDLDVHKNQQRLMEIAFLKNT